MLAWNPLHAVETQENALSPQTPATGSLISTEGSTRKAHWTKRMVKASRREKSAYERSSKGFSGENCTREAVKACCARILDYLTE